MRMPRSLKAEAGLSPENAEREFATARDDSREELLNLHHHKDIQHFHEVLLM